SDQGDLQAVRNLSQQGKRQVIRRQLLTHAARPVRPGFLLPALERGSRGHFAMCSFDRVVPIALNVAMIWSAEVSRKNSDASRSSAAASGSDRAGSRC